MQTTYRIIWIDDERDPLKYNRINLFVPKKFMRCCSPAPVVIWLKSYDEWTEFKSNHLLEPDDYTCYVDCYCFDHDLGSFTKDGTEKTGLDIAKELTEELMNAGRGIDFYECHSSNPAGKKNILSWLRRFEEVMGY